MFQPNTPNYKNIFAYTKGRTLETEWTCQLQNAVVE